MRSKRFFRLLSRSVRLPSRPAGMAVVGLAGILAACSVDTALTPPADIGSVGSISPVEAYQSVAAAPPAPSYAATAPFPDEQSSPGPVSSSSLSAPVEQPVSAERPLAPPPVSSDAGQQQSVSVLDTDRVVEGATSEPVVAGVGTGHPRTVGADRDALSAAPKLLSATARPGSEPSGDETRVAYTMRPNDPAAPAALSQPVRPAPALGDDGGMSASDIACRGELRRLGVRFTELPPISDGPACGIAHPIRVTGLSGGIAIKPAATLGCPVTVEFAKWVKRDAAPAARSRYLSGIRSITQLSSYSCRTMNSQRGAPMSEHAHGNAIDVGSFTLNSGRTIDVRKPGFFAFRQRGFLNTVRADSCGYFNTVLGPGTNKYHWNHFHFDLRHRTSGRSYCE